MIARSFPLFIGATLAATVPEQVSYDSDFKRKL